MKIDLEQYLKELELLVNMDSGQGNPEGITAVGNYLALRMKPLGWLAEQVDIGDKTGLCTILKNREASHYDVLLVGHVDTVFPSGETAKRPFYRDDTRAYGLGVLDMKQGDLAICYVLEQLPRSVLDKLNIVVIFNPDEEIGSIYSSKLMDSYATISDYAFVFEAASTDGSHTVQRKGSSRYKICFHGKAGHAGYMFDGSSISAINELLYWAYCLNGLTNREKGTGVNIGVIEGGEAVNIVPDFAQMSVEIRYEANDEYQLHLQVMEELKEHAKQLGVGVDIVEKYQIPPLIPNDKTKAYVDRVRCLAHRNGFSFELKSRGGLSDANHIAACCPIVIDGLAPTGDFDHSDKEYLELSTVEPNLNLIYLMLCDLADNKNECNQKL